MLTSAGQQDPERGGLFFLALDIATFADLDTFKAEVDEKIQVLRNSRRAKGVDRIYLPGEPEWIKRESHIRDGIPFPDGILRSLEKLGSEFETAIAPNW